MGDMRNNRSAGDDQIKAEMFKSAPDILHELLSTIYQKQGRIPQN